MWFILPYYQKIYIFAVLYNYKTESSFVYLIN